MPKEIVIKEMMNRYKITENMAKVIYDSYKSKEQISELEQLLFYRGGVFNVPSV